MINDSTGDPLARLRALSAQAAAIEQATREALAPPAARESRPSELSSDEEVRFQFWRKKTEREYAARLAAALVERDLHVDNPFKIAAADRLVALEEATNAANTLRMAYEVAEEKRASLQEQLDHMTAICHERGLALDSLHAQSALVESRVHELTKACEDRVAALATSQKRHAEVSAQLEALNTEYTALLAAHTDLGAVAQARVEALEESVASADYLREALDRSERERESSTLVGAELTRACEDRLAALEQLNAEYLAVSAEAQHRAEIIASLRDAATKR